MGNSDLTEIQANAIEAPPAWALMERQLIPLPSACTRCDPEATSLIDFLGYIRVSQRVDEVVPRGEC